MGQEAILLDNESEINQVAAALQAIGHPTRLKILCFLDDQDRTVNEILAHVGTTQSNVSQHIEVLRKVGAVRSRRVRNKVFCSLQKVDVMPLIGYIREAFCIERKGSRLYAA